MHRPTFTRRFLGHQWRYHDRWTQTPTSPMDPYSENYWRSWDRACGNRPFYSLGCYQPLDFSERCIETTTSYTHLRQLCIQGGGIWWHSQGRLPLGRWVQMTERVSDYLAILRTVWWLINCQVLFIWVSTAYRFFPKLQHHDLETSVGQVTQNNTLPSILCLLRAMRYDLTHRIMPCLV